MIACHTRPLQKPNILSVHSGIITYRITFPFFPLGNTFCKHFLMNHKVGCHKTLLFYYNLHNIDHDYYNWTVNHCTILLKLKLKSQDLSWSLELHTRSQSESYLASVGAAKVLHFTSCTYNVMNFGPLNPGIPVSLFHNRDK